MEDKNKSFSWSNKDYSSFSTSSSLTNPFLDYYERRRFRYYDDYYTTGSSYYRSERRSSMSSFMSSNYGFNSSFSLKDKKDEAKKLELFNKSVKLAREFISILNFPFPISIQVTSDIQETIISKDTRNLFLSTKILDNIDTRNENDIINIIVGQGLHEAAHIKYTNIKVLSEIDKDAFLSFENIFIKLLVNVLEDERVDRLLVLDRPGYSVFIDSAKEYVLSNFSYDKSTCTKEENVIINLIYLIRDQKKLDNDFILENEDLFAKINSVLNKFLTRTAEVIDTAKEIVCILKSQLSPSFIDECRKLIEKIRDIFIPLLYGDDRDLTYSKCVLKKHICKNIELSKDFNTGIKESLGILKKYENNFYIVRDESSYNESLKSEYNKIKETILKFIPLIKNKLQTIEKNTKFNIPGCRSGLLDTEKLVEAYQNVPQVYTRVGTMTTNSVTVCIVVDESGSMSCSSRYKTAKKAAILLYESLKDLSGINLYIYGHTADQTIRGSVEVRSYIEPGTKNYLSLCNISARYENRDGDAILGIAKRIRSFTQDKCLMFIISDGQPCAYDYWDDAAIKDSAEKIKRAKSLGFDMMQITISGDIRATKIMFGKNYIDLRHDLSELPEKLGKLIRDHVMKNKTTTITS